MSQERLLLPPDRGGPPFGGHRRPDRARAAASRRPGERSDPVALLVAGLLLLTVSALATSVLVLVGATVLCGVGLARSAFGDLPWAGRDR